jgi:HSP20 family protein
MVLWLHLTLNASRSFPMSYNIAKKNPSPVSVRQQQNANPVISLQNEINRLFNEFDNFFAANAVPSLLTEAPAYGMLQPQAQQQQPQANVPAIDVSENDKEYVIKAELPGVDPKNIDVSVSNNRLTIKAEKQEECASQDANVIRKESACGAYKATIQLPENTNPQDTQAKTKNGVLTVTVPKNAASAESKKVKVQAA